MKKFIAILFLALCSLALATPGEPAAAHPADSVAIADSVIIDSALYYDSLAARLQFEGDSLLNEATENTGFAIVMALLGGAGTIWGLSTDGSLEGGGVAVTLILIPSAILLGGGVFGILEGIGTGTKADMRIRKAEEYRKSADRHRTKTQQVKVDLVPLVDPFNKSVGGMLAMEF